MVLAVSGLASGSAKGQTFAASIDFGTPSVNTEKFAPYEPVEMDFAPAWALAIYSGSVFSSESRGRFGLVLGRQQVTARSLGTIAPPVRYTAFNVQLGTAIRIVGGSKLNLSVGLAAGLSFRTDNLSCNELGCTLPSSLILISPSVKATVHVTRKIAGILEVRSAAYIDDIRSSYPFESGMIVSVGVEVGMGGGGS